MSKPRITYAQFIAQQPKKQTLGQLIERYIEAMKNINREVGESQQYALRAIARRPIAQTPALDLTRHHVIEFARQRNREGVKPSTVKHDLSDICVVLNYAGGAWDDCDGVSAAPVNTAKLYLEREGIYGNSQPRERRPTPDELGELIWHFNVPAKRGHKRRIDMAGMTVWQPLSGRRIGESCALLWVDWNRRAQTILVRKMKDPKRRGKMKTVALPDAANRFLKVMWYALPRSVRRDVLTLHPNDPRQPRIFGYRARSVVSAYCNAKRRTGIDGLHLHDSRRECGSRLVEAGYAPTQAILVTGHETPAVFERVYMKPRPETFKDGPLAGRTFH